MSNLKSKELIIDYGYDGVGVMSKDIKFYVNLYRTLIEDDEERTRYDNVFGKWQD